MIVGKMKLLLAGRGRFRGNVNPSLSILSGRLLTTRSGPLATSAVRNYAFNMILVPSGTARQISSISRSVTATHPLVQSTA